MAKAKELKLNKPAKDFRDADFDEFLYKKDVVEKQARAKPSNAFTSEDDIAYRLINDRSLRIYKVGTVFIESATLNGSGQYRGSATVNHKLGYIPTFLGFYKVSGGTSFRPIGDFDYFFGFTGYRGFSAINARASSQVVTFELFTAPNGLGDPNVPSTPYEIKYYIFREKVEIG